MNDTTLRPIPTAERWLSLDVLRGVAVLGILVMNVQSFGMVLAAYRNPSAYGDLEGANLLAWLASHVLADRKFMPLFALLFGAGIAIQSERAEDRGQDPAALHVRRMIGLLGIGLAHAYLLWYGDILTTYALCGLWVFLLRKVALPNLLAGSVLLYLIPVGLHLSMGWSVPFWPEESVREAAEAWRPPPDEIRRELAAYRGSWLEQWAIRARETTLLRTFVFAFESVWRTTALMLLGVALHRWGFFRVREHSSTGYRRFAYACFLIGGPLVLAGAAYQIAHRWAFPEATFFGLQFNVLGGPLVALGYAATVMLAVRSGVFPAAQRALAAVGRMAFTNYLLQTVICTTIFYGHGLGLFGRVDRVGLLGIVAGVWALEIAVSVLWLRRFRSGPVEWLWRSVTYGRLQSLRRDPGAPAAS